jgi:hypothetical protein
MNSVIKSAVLLKITSIVKVDTIIVITMGKYLPYLSENKLTVADGKCDI